MNKKKFLIVGGAGFIGSWLSRYLLDLGHKVVIIDPQIICEDFKVFSEGELEKILKFRQKLRFGALEHLLYYQEGGKQILDDFKPDIIVHLAATPLEKIDDQAICKKQITNDIEVTFELAKDIKNLTNRKYKPRLIYMSSLFAYGDFNSWSINETYVLNPKTPYGIGKATGEFIIQTFLTNYATIRSTSIYGFGDANMRANKVFVSRALQGKDFWVNGNAWLDFIYIKDFIRGVVDVALSDYQKEAFHISGGHAINLEVFAKEIIKYFPGTKYEVKIGLKDRPIRGTLDNTKARISLGWKPEFSLQEGVKEYLKDAKKHGIG